MLIVPYTTSSEGEPLITTVERALEGGVNWVMLRVRELPSSACINIAVALRQRTQESGALFSVNPYLELAEWCLADGVHLPENKLYPLEERYLGLIRGYSVHSVEQAKHAQAIGADYLLVGTLFPTPSHPDKTPEGLPLLKGIAQTVSIPLIGIGGITPERVPECLQAGACGVAVISGILRSDNPKASAQYYWQSLHE